MLLIILLHGLFFYSISCQSFATDASVDPNELRCLVCEACITEIDKAISKLDPGKRVDVGGHRLDADGNYNHKTVPQSKSELYLSEMMDNVCDRMDDYIRAKWKTNGTLTLLNMIGDNGKMNSNWGDVDIIQDDDLNKSLKYNCEIIIEEFEEVLIELYQSENLNNMKRRFCTEESQICRFKSPNIEL